MITGPGVQRINSEITFVSKLPYANQSNVQPDGTLRGLGARR